MAPLHDCSVRRIGLQRLAKTEDLVDVGGGKAKDETPPPRPNADQALDRQPLDRLEHRCPAYTEFGRHPVDRDLLAGLELAPEDPPADRLVGLVGEISVLNALKPGDRLGRPTARRLRRAEG